MDVINIRQFIDTGRIKRHFAVVEGDRRLIDMGKKFSPNNLITLIGAALGIVPGVLLTQAVLMSVHSENNVFAANVSPLSILYATLITCVFSILIELFITRKVRTLNMVEALKSVE